ncbi:MAG: DUF362 domain-containing protein [Deltaproteobacteria bacterium]|jgi:uncharacterized Fe-S center protein|nr:DUF362 domain-containing protein [Deltaproteobacteria bacterium]
MATQAEVFFTSMRCEIGDSLLNKLRRIFDKAGLDKMGLRNKFAAIKIHFGEPGNLAYLRPNFAKTLADRIAGLGGLPFLTDCGTLYVGRRTHALSHLEAARENGFSPAAAGCQIIIADGLKGTDDVEVPIEGGIVLKTALIGRALMDADVVFSLNHFKGHELTGFGGAIKNLGMGGGSRAGKMVMHNDGKPKVDPGRCAGCGTCAKYCAQSAIAFKSKKARIDEQKCAGCGRCIGTCNHHAIVVDWDTSGEALNRKMAEYAKAVVQGRPNFHINVVNQVSPCCDCHSENDAAVVPDIGIFASHDPVAVDAACIEAVNSAPALAGSINDERPGGGPDHFRRIHPTSDWRSQLDHAEKIGLGVRSYKLVTVK